jgi:hypothetical protein
MHARFCAMLFYRGASHDTDFAKPLKINRNKGQVLNENSFCKEDCFLENYLLNFNVG